MTRSLVIVLCLALSGLAAPAEAGENKSLRQAVDARAAAVEDKVIAWRRDIHEHPELSNREVRTAALVAAHLASLGFDEIQTGVAHTGVVGILKGALPGPVVALRADMDALPVTERVDLPFASKARAMYNGNEVGVMHACGHDNHTAMLMGAAEVLAGLRDQLPGTVKFIFQPAEEGAPEGEEGGAMLMIKEGVLGGEYIPEAIFGLHVWPEEAGSIHYRAKGALAAADWLQITVTGRQTHGSSPWRGVDPIIVAAQIMTGLQAIPSRQLDITTAPAVVSIGSIHGGLRGNIIPDEVVMTGTIRTFDREMQADLHERIRRTAKSIAEAASATAKVTITAYAPVTYNDPDLTARMLPSLQHAAGRDKVSISPLVMGSEDFSHFQKRIPGVFALLGVNRPGVTKDQAAANQSPLFYANEDALIVGVKALSTMAVDYLAGN